MAHGERLRPAPGRFVTWDGFRWKPVPDQPFWHKWDPKPEGAFTTVPEDDVPGEVWAEVAKRALMGEDP